MSTAHRLNRIAETDSTFRRHGTDWVGKCLICGGPLRFDARMGEGATVELIVSRGQGGTHELRSLGIAHRRCNGEKGIHWDDGARRTARPERYAALVERSRTERMRCWRVADPDQAEVTPR
jgi:5-methylcytosine-specific restriction endonuclease McrA